MNHKALKLHHALLFIIILSLHVYFYFNPITMPTPFLRMIIFSIIIVFFLIKYPPPKIKAFKQKEFFLWLTCFLFIFFRLFVFSMDRIVGDSMYPTLHNGDVGIYLYGAPIERFDIVSVMAPNEKKCYTKRVIGLEGETIKIKKGHISINDVKIKEDFLHIKYPITFGPYTIPKGHVFLIGDNRPISLDSTHLGAFDVDSIDSKLILKFSPPPFQK